MPQKTLAKAGVVVAALTVLVCWGATRWLQTRSFEPLNVAIVLAGEQTQTARFAINLRESYWVELHLDYSSDDWAEGKCNGGDSWPMRWKVYRLNGGVEGQRKLYAVPGDPHDFFCFRAAPGLYELEWTPPTTASCLNARHPRVEVWTDSAGYEQAVECLWIAGLLTAGTGIMLALRLFLGSLLVRPGWKGPLRIFPEMVMRNVLPRKWHRPMPPFSAPLDFGIAWGSVLMALVFIFVRGFLLIGYAKGLPLRLEQSSVIFSKHSPWPQTLGVYVDGQGRFLVNGEIVKRENLAAKLQQELGKRVEWTVYVEAHPDTAFQDTVYSIDTIRGLGAKAVWITPGMRAEWKQEQARLP